MSALAELTIDAAGLALGAVGLGAAVWLQMVTPDKVDERYVAGFFALGALLVLYTVGAWWPSFLEPTRASVVALLAAGELRLLYQVVRDDRLRPVASCVDDVVGGRR